MKKLPQKLACTEHGAGAGLAPSLQEEPSKRRIKVARDCGIPHHTVGYGCALSLLFQILQLLCLPIEPHVLVWDSKTHSRKVSRLRVAAIAWSHRLRGLPGLQAFSSFPFRDLNTPSPSSSPSPRIALIADLSFLGKSLAFMIKDQEAPNPSKFISHSASGSSYRLSLARRCEFRRVCSI